MVNFILLVDDAFLFGGEFGAFPPSFLSIKASGSLAKAPADAAAHKAPSGWPCVLGEGGGTPDADEL